MVTGLPSRSTDLPLLSMSSCWRYAGKRARYWLYGRIAWVSAPKKSSYQMPMRPEQHRQVRLERRGAEVLVDRCGSRRASRRTARDRSRSSATGRWRSRTSSGHRPSPRTRTCWRCRCRTSPPPCALVDTATKCLATADSSPPRPATLHSRARPGVGEGLERGERLRRDDEQRLGRVEVVGGLPEVGAVDVAHEPERHVALREVAQGVVGHVRSEVGAADADVDDVADALAGVADPLHRERTRSEKSAILRSTACTTGTTFSPSTSITAPSGARSAACRTARSSVTLIFSPRNIASMRSRRPARCASATRSRSVSSVIRFLE